MEYHNKFTPEQTKWLEALESGEWEQTDGYLRDRERDGQYRYCCLGVATTLIDPDNINLEIGNGICSLGSVAPEIVVETLMLFDNVGSAPSLDDGDLTIKNDEQGYSFEAIAKFIRDEPWKVFSNFGESYQKKDDDNV